MAKFDYSQFEDPDVTPPPPPRGGGRGRAGIPGGGGSVVGAIVAVVLVVAFAYGGYYWFVKRVVVNAGEVLVLMRKDGSKSLPGDQIIIPTREGYHEGDEVWQERYGDANGILEEVMRPGTDFISPFDFEREIFKVRTIPSGKVGIVVRKFGEPLPPDRVLARKDRNERGPLAEPLAPGQYPEYSNPYAYDIIEVDPVNIDEGFRGIITVVAGTPAQKRNTSLVDNNERGVQEITEPSGFRYVNPFERRLTPISTKSQRFEMSDGSGQGVIRFPSADSFEISLEGFVEWKIDPERLPLTYVQYSEGGDLIPILQERVILPYARSFCRLVGSRYTARDLISGDKRLEFQKEFEELLRKACSSQGIIIDQALVRDIQPPRAITELISERAQAKEEIAALMQQIEVAKSTVKLIVQEETAKQNQSIGDANKEVVTVVADAERKRNVALTQAQQRLEVAKLRLEAAQKQAEALVSRGQAEADIILLNRKAEAEPLQRQIAAFGDGASYARFFFYQQVAPSMKSILTNSDGVFADIFQQFNAPPAQAAPGSAERLAGEGR